MSATWSTLWKGIACAAVILVMGCASTPLRVPMPEPMPHDGTPGRELTQRACGFMFGGVVPIGMSDRYQRGYDYLVAQAPGQYITDVSVQEVLTYAFVGWRYCANFRATVYPVAAR